jgi:hypothetical protein
MEDVTYIDELPAGPRSTSLVLRNSRLPTTTIPIDLIDEYEEQTQQTYYTVLELKAFWELAYKEYVFPALYGRLNPRDGIARVDELQQLLDQHMITLLGTGDEQVIDELQRLKTVLARVSPERIEDERKKLRHAARKVTKALSKMAERAAYPTRFSRMMKAFGVTRKIVIRPEARERLRVIAGESILGLSTSVADKIGMRQVITAAYNELGLGVWATREEVIARHRYLAKQYHPDKNPVGEERMMKINEAAQILLREKYGWNSVQGSND